MNRISIFSVILMLMGFVANAQISIKGTVYDKDSKEVLPGVNIVIRGKTQHGTTTDVSGKFNVTVKEHERLILSFTGFKTLELSYNDLLQNPERKFYMEPGILLNEVTVTASLANSRSKKAIGANIEHIDAGKIVETSNPSSLADIMNGRISGTQVYNTNGKVGMPIRFDIRSSATFSMDRDPLIFIDGIRYNNSNTSDINSSQEGMSALNDLPLNDIASIDVIKGPSAAASYGAEAANGVIVIQTKRGVSGKKGISVNAKYTTGFSQLANKYTQFVNNDAINNFFDKGTEQQVYANMTAQFDQNNSLFFSVNNNVVNGIVPGNRDNRQTIRAGYDFSKDRFKLALTAGFVKGKLSIPQSASGRNDAIWNLMRTKEPWAYITEDTWRAIDKSYDNSRFTGSVKAGYTFPLDIKMETLIGLDVNNIKGVNYLAYGYLLGTSNTGSKTLSNRSNDNLNWDFKLNRNFILNSKLQLNLVLLSQLTRSYEKSSTINVRNFAVDGISNVGSAAEILSVGETDFEKRTHGLYGEAFLSYNDVLFINTGLRRDVSNMVGRNVVSIWYPTVSVAYNIAKLPFLHGKVDEWKLRASYGQSGRLPYPTDAQTSYLVQNSSFGTSVTPNTKGNPDIKPERTSELEFGTDINLFKQRISFTYYRQRTTDAIVYTTLKPSLGWPSSLSGDYPENIGIVSGQGIELSINSRVFTSNNNKNSIDVFAILNHQSNEVVNANGRDILNTVSLIRQGLPTYAFYSTVSEGPVFNAAGVYTGAKESELKYLGKPFPTFNGSFGFRAQLLGNLSIQSLFTYSQGAKVYNISMRNVASQGDNFKASEDLKALLATQTPDTDAYRATATELAKYANYRGNYIESNDFIRLSNLTISYDLGTWAARQTGGVLKRCVISVTGNNLWLNTSYKGAEPQIDSQGGSSRTRGIGSLSYDWTAVPAPKTFALNLNIGF